MKRTVFAIIPFLSFAAFADDAAVDPAAETASAMVETTNVVTVTVVATNYVDEVVKDPKVQATTNLVTRLIRLHHVPADEFAEKINTMWSGDFGSLWKISKVAQAFPDANAVMVTAPEAVAGRCAEMARELDVEPRQVYIEARFVELSASALHKLGINWEMLEGMKGSATLGGGINAHNVGKGVEEYTRTITDSSGTTKYSLSGGTSASASRAFSGGSDGSISHFSGTLDFSEMYVVLSALEGEGDTRIFSNPRIIVASGRKATVDMTTKYPNVNVSAKRTLNGNAESLDLAMNMAAIPGEDHLMFAKEAFFSWGISLEVTPRVETNDLIGVTIVPTISSLNTELSASGFVTASDGGSKSSTTSTYSSKYPIIDVQRLVTEFSMKSGTTAVIGGLSKTAEEQVDSGIPWLRDIPWIGDKFFGGRLRQKVQKEILVFVTVGIARPSDIPADVGLPKNAVMGREYTEGVRKEPGDRRSGIAGVTSLDLRSLDEQARDPQWTNKVDGAELRFPVPFTKKK